MCLDFSNFHDLIWGEGVAQNLLFIYENSPIFWPHGLGAPSSARVERLSRKPRGRAGLENERQLHLPLALERVPRKQTRLCRQAVEYGFEENQNIKFYSDIAH